MTKKELAALLAPLAVRYPQTLVVNAATVELWREVIGKLEFDSCRRVVFDWLSEPHEFPPGPGDIRSAVEKGLPCTRSVEILEHSYRVTTEGQDKVTGRRVQHVREYVRISHRERWQQKKALAERGYCLVRIPHTEYTDALCIMHQSQCVQIGWEEFEGEKLPRWALAE